MDKKRKGYIKSPGDVSIPKRTLLRAKRRNEAHNTDLLTDVQYFSEFNQPGPELFQSRSSVGSKNIQNVDRNSESEPDEISTTRTSSFLYLNSKITDDEATLLLIGFMAKHKMTRAASEGLITLINFFLPKETYISDSIYSLKKKIPCTSNITSKHYYCESCDEYLGEIELGLEKSCSSCQASFSTSHLSSSGSYFLVFDIKSQLEFLLRNSHVANKLFSRLGERNFKMNQPRYPIKDIVDGKMYKMLKLDKFDFTCLVNTDGVPVFKSSKASIWPILLSLNELEYRDRCKSTIMAALWFGKRKPNFDSFFQPFVTELCSFARNNKVTWKNKETIIESRVYFPILVADSPARCLCQGTVQFNGAYGCTWCLTKGENFQLGHKSRKWIYPPSSSNLKLRNKEQFTQHLRDYSALLESGNTAKSNFGVKNASKLILVPQFNIVNGFAFDVMHAAFLGVSRTLTNIWMDSKYHDQSFYIGLKLKEINSKLSNYLVPEYFSRSVRTFDESKFWKASEWRTWTFIAPLVLDNILPTQFLSHFSKYIRAIMILTGESISEKDINDSRSLLIEFVAKIPSLYGLNFCTFNCHSLLHAADCVDNWGPLFSYSAFQFENFNGVILNLFNGANRIDIQISNKLNELICTVNWSYNITQTPAVQYFLHMVKNIKYRKNIQHLKSVLFFGSSKSFFLPRKEKLALEKVGIENCKFVQCFPFCYVNSLVFSTSYKRSKLRCDSIAESNGDLFQIHKLFIADSKPLCFVSKIVVSPVIYGMPFSYKVVRISKEFTVLNVCNLMSKFIVNRNNSGTIVNLVKLPNTAEFE